MSGKGNVRALFDTNIIIDYLQGDERAKHEIDRFDERYISVITYIEVLVGVKDKDDGAKIKMFLKTFQIIPHEGEIVEKTIALRQTYRLKIPDAVILASAEHHSALLVTRDVKDYPSNHPLTRVPYTFTV